MATVLHPPKINEILSANIDTLSVASREAGDGGGWVGGLQKLFDELISF